MVNRSAHPAAGFVGRLTWMLIGPAALFLTGLAVVRGSGWLTWPDLAYMAALGVTILGRWVEYLAGDPRTADGEPATAAHVRRYSLAAVVIGLGVWAALNVWANHWAW
jgi:hypothetical protein